MATKKLKRKIYSLLAVTALAFSLSGGTVMARSSVNAEAQLSQQVYNDLQNQEFSLEGGGTVSGRELFVRETENGQHFYNVNADLFQDLESKEKTRFTDEIVESTESHVGERGITNNTASGLLKRIQSTPGMGSRLLTNIMAFNKPDYAGAARAYKPFSGLIGFWTAVGAVFLVSALGLVIVSDMAYIAIPIIRAFGDMKKSENGGDGAIFGKFIFSDEATSAVKDSQNGGGSTAGGGGSGYRSALGLYFKRRAIMMLVFGFCLLYLVHGEIYVIIAFLLDIVSGFFSGG